MPTYDYHCDACEHEFEHFQTITSPLLTKCPKCGKKKLRRLFGTGAALVFKGSGFYTTDYRSDSYKDAAKKDKPAGDGKGSDGKSSDGKSSGDAKSSDGGSGDKSAKKDAKPKPPKAE
ncbi:MAG: zinc ribbon domain-containing protein [Pirellulales bacterium]